MAVLAHHHKTQQAVVAESQQDQQAEAHNYQQQQQQQQQRSMASAVPDDAPHVRAFLPGAVSLIEQLDTRVLVILRDGRHLVGTLRSLDQFSNLVLEDSFERHIVENKYADIYLGLYILRGESIVMVAEIVSPGQRAFVLFILSRTVLRCTGCRGWGGRGGADPVPSAEIAGSPKHAKPFFFFSFCYFPHWRYFLFCYIVAVLLDSACLYLLQYFQSCQADEDEDGAGDNMEKVEMDVLLDAKANLKNPLPLWDFWTHATVIILFSFFLQLRKRNIIATN